MIGGMLLGGIACLRLDRRRAGVFGVGSDMAGLVW